MCSAVTTALSHWYLNSIGGTIYVLPHERLYDDNLDTKNILMMKILENQAIYLKLTLIFMYK